MISITEEQEQLFIDRKIATGKLFKSKQIETESEIMRLDRHSLADYSRFAVLKKGKEGTINQGRTVGLEVFGIKDTLQPIKEYMEEIRNSQSFKDYEERIAKHTKTIEEEVRKKEVRRATSEEIKEDRIARARELTKQREKREKGNGSKAQEEQNQGMER